MSFDYILSQFVNGIKLGSIYAVVAIGYSMVYGILKLINFAHGDLMTVGVYTMLVLMGFSERLLELLLQAYVLHLPAKPNVRHGFCLP